MIIVWHFVITCHFMLLLQCVVMSLFIVMAFGGLLKPDPVFKFGLGAVAKSTVYLLLDQNQPNFKTFSVMQN
jgi:hypothetical protein